MTVESRIPHELSPAERERRKRYLGATVITCIAVAMVFGALHVVKLGANRMADMRNRASYDLEDMSNRIRAAGEDITRHRVHEQTKSTLESYSMEEVDGLLPAQQWLELATMITVPAGPFQMGTDNPKADIQNKPQHTVELPAFKIDKYPVTGGQYAQFVFATKHRAPLDWVRGRIPDGKVLHPVAMVTWYDGRDYCAWAGKRLPTEAEWEKAARGSDGRRWPWGNEMNPDLLNTYYHIGNTNDVTAYVGGVSPYGVFDMAGDVSEWTASEFKPYPGSNAHPDVFVPKKLEYSQPSDKAMKVADMVPTAGVFMVRRGGSWKSDPFSTAAYHRDYSLPHYASDFFGFRCAKDAK